MPEGEHTSCSVSAKDSASTATSTLCIEMTHRGGRCCVRFTEGKLVLSSESPRYVKDGGDCEISNCFAQLDLPWVAKNLVFLSRAAPVSAPHPPLSTFPLGSGSWGTLVWISNFWSFEFSPAETSFSSFGFPFLPSSLFLLFLPYPLSFPPFP